MRENKIAIIWSSAISLISIVVSVILHITSFEYISNLFAGVFSGSVLALLVATINYSVARRKTLERFFIYAFKAADNFKKFNNDNLESAIDSVLLMAQFDYLELENAYGDICFIHRHRQNFKYISENIYEPILNLRNLILKNSVHFKEYRKAENGDTSMMQVFIEQIDAEIMDRTNNLYEGEKNTTKVSFCRNKIAETLQAELRGKYYRLMYPRKKNEQ